jgi:hypothetical protein
MADKEWVVDVSSVYGIDEKTAADIRDHNIDVGAWLIDMVKGGFIQVVNVEEL